MGHQLKVANWSEIEFQSNWHPWMWVSAKSVDFHKVQIIWEGHKNLKIIPILVWCYRVILNKGRIFFSINVVFSEYLNFTKSPFHIFKFFANSMYLYLDLVTGPLPCLTFHDISLRFFCTSHSLFMPIYFMILTTMELNYCAIPRELIFLLYVWQGVFSFLDTIQRRSYYNNCQYLKFH